MAIFIALFYLFFKDTVTRPDETKEDDHQLLEEVVKVGHTMDTLRNALLDQQSIVRHLIENSKQQPQPYKKIDQAYQNNDEESLPSEETTTHRNASSSSSELGTTLNNSLTLPNPAQDEVLTHQGLGVGISAR